MKIKESIKNIVKDKRVKCTVAYMSVSVLGLLTGLALGDLLVYYANKG